LIKTGMKKFFGEVINPFAAMRKLSNRRQKPVKVAVKPAPPKSNNYKAVAG